MSKRIATESMHTVDDVIVYGIDTEREEVLLVKLRCCMLGSPEILLIVADAWEDHESWSYENPAIFVVIVDRFFGIDARVLVVSNGCLFASAVDVWPDKVFIELFKFACVA